MGGLHVVYGNSVLSTQFCYGIKVLKINFINFFKKGSEQVYENMIGNLKRGNKRIAKQIENVLEISMNFVVTL